MVGPYLEEHISSIEVIRTFLPTVESSELKWHQDWEDREVVFLNENDWSYQIDNELPKPCSGTIFIKSGTWHRVIKGKTDLRVKITKYQNSKDI